MRHPASDAACARPRPASCSLYWATLAAFVLLALLAVPVHAQRSDPPRAAPAALAQLEALERAFQDVVERVAPSVVGIRSQRRYVAPGTDANAPNGQELEQHVIVNGSGTVVGADGLILTNEHVVRGAGTIDVLLYDGEKLRATVLASDARSDLAVLKVPRSGLRPVTFGDWDRVDRGQWAIVIGNPFGLGVDGQLSVSIGVISNLNRQLPGLGEVDDRFYNDMIQVTAPIHPGNSGGPLFNLRGELIGVVTAMHTRAPADEGVGFAVPMTPTRRRIVDVLCQGQRVAYGYLGLTVRVPEAAERQTIGVEHGVIVDRVEPGGPAERAGVLIGDVLLSYDRQPVTGPAHLAELTGQTPVGAEVRLELLRDGRPATIRVTLERRDISRVSWMRGDAITWRGMRLADLSDDARRRMHVAEPLRGVIVIDVEPDSPAARAAMRIGDVIEEVGGQRIEDTLDFLLRVRQVQGTLEVTVRHEGRRQITP